MYDNPEIVPDPILSLYNKPEREPVASKILKQAEAETQKALDTLDKFGRIAISYFPIYSKDRHPDTGEELDLIN